MINDFLKFPFYIITHPIDGFYDMKHEKKGKLSVAVIFIICTSLVSIIQYQYTGFLVNENNLNNMNSIKQFAFTLIPILLFSIGNWSVTTLMDGKGKFKEIVMTVGYASFPLIIICILNTIYSNFIIQNETAFYYFFQALASGWYFLLIFTGMLVIHDYSVKKGVATIFLTVIAVGIIIFIAILFFSLIQQMYGFAHSVYKEILLRIG